MPEEAATYLAPKMAVVAIANPPKYPELATLYSHLWAGFANGITVPETFVHMFSVLGRTIAHDYYCNMALGYITLRHIAAANAHHFDQDTLNGFLITLAVYRCQVPLLPRIWDQILSRLSNAAKNDWTQVRRFTRHPASHPPLFGLTFVPPSTPTAPWGIRTQWSERELMSLLAVIQPLRDALSQLLCFADAFVRMQSASIPLRGITIPGLLPEGMFPAPFITATPFENGLALPPPTTNPGPSKPETPAENEDANTSMSTVWAGIWADIRINEITNI